MTLFGGRGFVKGMIIGLAVAGMVVPAFAQDAKAEEPGQPIDFPSMFDEMQGVMEDLKSLGIKQVETENRVRGRIADESQIPARLAVRLQRSQQAFRQKASEALAGMAPSVRALAASAPAAAGGSYVLFLKDTLFPDVSGAKLAIGDFSVLDHGGGQTLGAGSGVTVESLNGCPVTPMDFFPLSQASTVAEFTEIEGSGAEGISRVKSIQASAFVQVPTGVPGEPPHTFVLNLFPTAATGVNDMSGGTWFLTVVPGNATCNGGFTFAQSGAYDFVNSVIAAPEPPLTLLFGTGFAALYFLRRRYRIRLAS